MKEKRIKQFEQLKNNIKYLDIKINKSDVIDLLSLKPNFNNLKSTVFFSNSNVVDTLRDLANPLVLVFSSAKNPGGGVLRGSLSQEEDLSRATTWYFNVKDSIFYNISHENLLYSSNAVYVDNAYLLSDSFGNFIIPKKIGMIGIASPNLSGMINNKSNIDDKLIYSEVEKRLLGLLYLASHKSYNEIVVGAWGCGVFGLNSERVANIYKKLIDKNLFKGSIIFSISNKEQMSVFKSIIGE